ncbi:ty3-gypsy retrotransposon protein [Cucumis melo var. makuwa]|uniref:Ty3-gypsy retrotransposon protein n=1 Tax=Cucumis melo var. makuwa TaxID=1194695 RepID=A0A5D3CEJ2_CUCMM|nr:ty3-gypsy retrotransposon protein [Cucumis melo var. makuwa]TYK09614.1 ty3-gypsy retrotransposon protein [Cucumis melo var. makuwa]
MAEMERKINLLMKVSEERDHEITTLRDQMQTRETTESSKTPLVKADDKGKAMLQENEMQQSIYATFLSVQQLQVIITSSIRAQYEGPQQTSFNDLRMSIGYQPPKFQ